MEEKKKKPLYSHLFEWVVILSLSLMVTFVFINATLRYFFNTAFTQSEEFARFLFLMVIFLGAIAANKENGHVRIEMLSNALKGKARTVLAAISKSIEIGIILYLLYSGIEYTKQASTYVTAATGINFGLIAAALPIMAAGMLLVEISKLINYLRSKRDRDMQGGK